MQRIPLEVIPDNVDDLVNWPAYLEISSVNLNSTPSRRIMAVLRTPGCAYGKTSSACSMCGFRLHADPNVKQVNLQAQLDLIIKIILETEENIEQIDLLTLGSFFDDDEISPDFRTYACAKISEVDRIKKLVIETRASHITDDKLKTIKRHIPNKDVEVGIGVESSDDAIRNGILNKGLSWDVLKTSVKKLASIEFGFQPYLLIKPPNLSEAAAIDDAVKSAFDVVELAKEYKCRTRVAFEPVFIPKDTELEELYNSGKYKVVNLWSIVEVIKKVHGLVPIFIGMSDEGLAKDRVPTSCNECSENIGRAIQIYNATQNIDVLSAVNCSCKKEWLQNISQE